MDLRTKDSAGVTAESHTGMEKSRFLHVKTRRMYVVHGFAWCGDTGQWMVLHHREDSPNGRGVRSSVVFARSVGNFLGNCQDGGKRFIEVEEED